MQVCVSSARMAQLPTHTYCDMDRKTCTDTKCAVCQCNFEDSDTVMPLPCRHMYHPGCITSWLSCSKNCPICLTPLES